MWRATAVLVLAACAFPAERTITGVLTRVERRPGLETVCHVGARLADPNSCHVPPVCCAYRLTVRDSAGHSQFFYAFWPDFAPGLSAMELRHMWFRLHRDEIVAFPCTPYGCRRFVDYMLESDDDWRIAE